MAEISIGQMMECTHVISGGNTFEVSKTFSRPDLFLGAYARAVATVQTFEKRSFFNYFFRMRVPAEGAKWEVIDPGMSYSPLNDWAVLVGLLKSYGLIGKWIEVPSRLGGA